MTEDPEGHGTAPDALENLTAIRSKALSRLFPGSLSSVKDASLELVPRILGSEVEYRSRLLEELATMQFMLMTEALRPLKDRSKASMPALVREMRALIKDQLRLVKEAPLGTGSESYKTQAVDLLQRRAVVLAEIRRRGLESLLRAPGTKETRTPERNPGLEEIAALVARGEAQPASEERSPDAGRVS